MARRAECGAVIPRTSFSNACPRRRSRSRCFCNFSRNSSGSCIMSERRHECVSDGWDGARRGPNADTDRANVLVRACAPPRWASSRADGFGRTGEGAQVTSRTWIQRANVVRVKVLCLVRDRTACSAGRSGLEDTRLVPGRRVVSAASGRWPVGRRLVGDCRCWTVGGGREGARGRSRWGGGTKREWRRRASERADRTPA